MNLFEKFIQRKLQQIEKIVESAPDKDGLERLEILWEKLLNLYMLSCGWYSKKMRTEFLMNEYIIVSEYDFQQTKEGTIDEIYDDFYASALVVLSAPRRELLAILAEDFQQLYTVYERSIIRSI